MLSYPSQSEIAATFLHTGHPATIHHFSNPVSETEHSPHTHQIQHQTQQLQTQPQSTSNRSSYLPSIYQLHESIHRALSIKHWEEDEEEEKMDIMKQEDDRD